MPYAKQHLSVITKIVTLLNTNAHLDKTLREIVDIISEAFGIGNCRVYIKDDQSNSLLLSAVNSRGYAGEEISSYRIGRGIVGVCAQKREMIVVQDIANALVEELLLLDEAGRYSSFFSFPLMDEEAFYGVLYLSDASVITLSDEDIKLLQLICGLLSNILREESFKAGVEKVGREFSILYEMSTAMMTTIKLDRLLHVILTAVTIGDGLGFNRAMLFLVNERSNIIQGMMGVGPDTYEEAWRAWDEYARSGKGLLDTISLHLKEEKMHNSRLNEIVKTIRLRLDAPCIVGKTVREQKPFNIIKGEEVQISEVLTEKLGLEEFACVPLMASGKVVGVILVDNHYNKKPITDEDVRFLIMFSNQAGLAIENSLLYSDVQSAHLELKETHERLLQSEKLAALGEMAANVAHEIRNPLTSVGGFARRLYKKLEDRSEKKYAEIIVKEVDRLERLLTDVLILSRKGIGALKSQNVHKILDSTLLQLSDDMKANKVQLVKEFSDSLIEIECDSQQLKQVFMNLITNSIQAMENGGILTVSTSLSWEGAENQAPHVKIAICDTGGGIPEKSLPNIFNPFFTTKDSGTGLGLSISHRIVTHHHGEIEVENRAGEGVTFIVKLPIRQKEAEEQEEP